MNIDKMGIKRPEQEIKNDINMGMEEISDGKKINSYSAYWADRFLHHEDAPEIMKKEIETISKLPNMSKELSDAIKEISSNPEFRLQLYVSSVLYGKHFEDKDNAYYTDCFRSRGIKGPSQEEVYEYYNNLNSILANGIANIKDLSKQDIKEAIIRIDEWEKADVILVQRFMELDTTVDDKIEILSILQRVPKAKKIICDAIVREGNENEIIKAFSKTLWYADDEARLILTKGLFKISNLEEKLILEEKLLGEKDIHNKEDIEKIINNIKEK